MSSAVDANKPLSASQNEPVPADWRLWDKLAHGGQLNTPGVMLLCCATNQEWLVAGWHLAVATVQYKDGTNAFTKAAYILPPAQLDHGLMPHIHEALEAQLQALGSKSRAESYFSSSHVRTIHLASLETDDIAKQLEQLDDGSAVAIIYSRMTREPQMTPDAPLASIMDWSGIEINIHLEQNLLFRSLIGVIRQALKIARSKNLLVTLFCDTPGLFNLKLPADLDSDPDLCVLTLSSVDEPIQEIDATLQAFEELTKRAKEEGPDSVLDEIPERIQDPVNRAFLTAHILAQAGHSFTAWSAITPHFDAIKKTGDPGLLLQAAHFAWAAGHTGISQSLLEEACAIGLTAIEHLHTAYLVAKRLGLVRVTEDLLLKLDALYPNHPVTIGLRLNQLIESRRYAEACPLAERLGLEFDRLTFEAFQDPAKLELTQLLDYARRTDDLDRAYFVIAMEARHRNVIELSQYYATLIDEESPFSTRALRLRMQNVGILWSQQGVSAQSALDEIPRLLRYVAVHPLDLNVRWELEDLFENGIELPASVSALVIYLRNQIKLARNQLTSAPIIDYSLIPDPSNEDIDDAYQFIKEVLERSPSGLVLGHGNLDETLLKYARPCIKEALTDILQESLKRMTQMGNDPSWLLPILHAIVLVCRHLNDTPTPFLVFRQTIDTLSRYGHLQTGRNLAEHLLALSNRPSLHTDYCVCQGWACYAAAFQGSGNAVSALLYLCLRFALYEHQERHPLLAMSSCRLAARVLRDLGFHEYALQAIDMERELGHLYQATEKYMLELDVTEYGIQVASQHSEVSARELLNLLERGYSLLSLSEHDQLPVIAAMVSLAGELKRRGEPIPQSMQDVLTSKISTLPLGIQNRFLPLLADPSRKVLLDIISTAASANSFSDLSYQLSTVRLTAEAALPIAVRDTDIDLFLLAASVLSQPVMSLVNSQREPATIAINPSKARLWLLKAIATNFDAKILFDAAQVAESAAPIQSKSIDHINSISVARIQAAMRHDEAIIVMASGTSGELYRSVIYKERHIPPQLLNSDVWSPKRFREWRKSYPKAYGNWLPRNLFEDDRPALTSSDVIESLHLLGPGIVEGESEKLVFVPDADTFGFPFNIPLNVERDIHKALRVSFTVPSVMWLTETRAILPKQALTSKKAWLASPATEDYGLLMFRDRLTPVLISNDFNIIECDTPVNLVGSDVAFAMSHGSTGLLDYFRHVTDEINNYPPEEFATHFHDCTLVILFICNSGRSDQRWGSQETLGLVTELLKAGVRCVIAPSWPLQLEIAVIWLPVFLENLAKGKSVAVSATAAAEAVRSRYDTPAAWGILQVYGDGSLSITHSP